MSVELQTSNPKQTRLVKIKLAGFKSFVDPTEFVLKSDLVAVVGPNGCGKSNVIDAVRWVMGESSAKNLRGESITDVIFNGSNTRKPIGQASIELYFDNSGGAIGGEYANYAEICVRREVNRNGDSKFFLNGTACRKRDITDVFLGTGLGARSYSIIEQGMISRVIESKPEELGKFIREAAGVSVYEKRRHDTELRMKHTIENLARLEDLREEQIKLLERLKRQSESAQKFKVFNAEKEELEAQLLTMRWQDYDAKLAAHSEQILDLSVQLEEKITARTTIGTSLEKVRVEFEENSAEYNEIQSKFYELGSLVARNEQSLQHHKERKQQLETDVDQVKQSIHEISAQKATDSDTLFECEEALAEITPEYEQARDAAEQADELYQDVRLELDSVNEAWDIYQEEVQIPQQQAEVQKTRIEQLDKQTRDLQARIDRLQQESSALDTAAMSAMVAELAQQLAILEEQTNNLKAELLEIQNKITTQRATVQQQQEQLNQARGIVQQSKGREASLLALQQAALGKDDKILQDWLQQHNLANLPRVAQSITVATGWDVAVETVLGDYLEAVCVAAEFNTVANTVHQLSAGKVTLLDATRPASSNATNSELVPLAQKITTSLPINDLLQNVYVCEDLTAALNVRDKLTAAQSIITKDGIWLGSTWIRISREQDAKRGILAREQELQQLKLQIEQQQLLSEELEAAILAATEELQSLEAQLFDKQQQSNQIAAQLRDVSAKHSAAQQKLENMQNRRNRINVEIEEHQQQLAINSSESSTARAALEIAIETMARLALRKEELLASKEELQNKERERKQQARELQDAYHELELKKQGFQNKFEGLQHTISRVDQQLAALHQRHHQLLQTLQDDIEPTRLLQAELDELLAQRSIVEADMQQAKRVLEVYEEQMRDQEKQRNELELAAEKIKSVLDQCKLDRQTLEVRRETINEQLALQQIDVQAILQGLPEEASEAEWAERIDALNRKISNLGAINMAAVEEFEAETQRQEYLETQYTDLKEALTTLENAIKKIDRETRARFKETFDQVNTNFVALFPKLFGGGRAYLEIVGEDLLEAGVTVMAQPPGKKNSTIHLLSGGEKALTAVSLVFSIFQLNPAPFCMLDEVDAPLDEANVGRFGNLIKEMSDKVQFIIITHNKATMQIANQLVGVTMKEPGVSRLVSVDINEAVEMATA
jgi:chromosome segregation protein